MSTETPTYQACCNQPYSGCGKWVEQATYLVQKTTCPGNTWLPAVIPTVNAGSHENEGFVNQLIR